MQMMVETYAVRQEHGMLKAVTDGKSLTSNIPGQHLSLLETKKFSRKRTNLAFDV